MQAESLVSHFTSLPDPREDNKRHKLIDIVVMAICGAVSGADKWEDIEEFGKAKESFLRGFLELPHGIPSHDTIARVFAAMDPEQFNRCFLSWIQQFGSPRQDIISIDGKTLRHSYDKRSGQPAIHMVSAWANEAGITLGQLKVDDKSNEITAIPELLDMLALEDNVVTIDAMGTQRAIARKIVDKGADYVLALKGNQGTLHEDVALLFEDAQENNFDTAVFDYHRSVDKDHGRIEVREYWVTEDIDWLASKNKWKGLRSVCMVKSQRTIGEETETDTRFFISTLEPVAQTIGSAVRRHWGIENSLHWVLDVAFREDECRKRKGHAAENFAIVRHMAQNLLKCERTCRRSTAGKRLRAGWDNDYLIKVLFQS